MSIREGEELFAAGDLDGAERCFRAALTRDPGNLDAMLDLAVVRHALAALPEARTLFAAVCEGRPDDATANEGLGACLVTEGRARDALAPLLRASALAPAEPGPRVWLGRACRALGELGSARYHLGAAARLDGADAAVIAERDAIDRYLTAAGYIVAADVEQVPPASAGLVSVVLAAYNAEPFLQDTLAALAAQSYPAWELIVTDDGSEDATVAIVEAFAARHPAGRVRLVRQENRGAAAARNRSAANAQGAFILPLDADDLLLEHYLARTVAAIASHPACGIAYPFYHAFGTESWLGATGPFRLAELRLANRLPVTSLIRRAVFEDLGGYREDYRGYEDWELWLRACHAGVSAVLVPEVLYLYRRVAGSKSEGDDRLRDQNVAQMKVDNPEIFPAHEVAAAVALLQADAA